MSRRPIDRAVAAARAAFDEGPWPALPMAERIARVSLKIGDALDPATDFGPVAVSRTRDRCESFVASALREGATLAGGVLGQPFGGYKRSGIGREMGLEGFKEWTQTKVLKVNDTGNYLA